MKSNQLSYLVSFIDLFAVSLIVPALGGHFLKNNVVWASSIYGIAQFFSQPLFGGLADRFGARLVTIVSIVITAASYYILSLGTNFIPLIIARLLAGTCKQTQELSRLSIVNSELEDNRARVIGLFNSIGSAGFIIGPIVGGFIRESYPENGFYICSKITSVLFLCNGLLVYTAEPIPPSFAKNNNASAKKKKASSTISILLEMWDLCLVRFLLTMGILMTRFVMPILADRAFGPAKSGFLTSFTSLAGSISAAAASYIVPKLCRQFSALLVETITCGGLALTLCLMASSWESSPVWSIFLSILLVNCFFTQCSRILLTELTVQRAPSDQRGSVLGTVTSLTAVSRALCDIANASLLEYGDLVPLLAAAGLCSSSALILGKLIPSTTKLKSS